MKPYYQDALATIYHGDSREILPQLEGYNVIVTDPPWVIQSVVDIKGTEDPVRLLTEVLAGVGTVDRLICILGGQSDPRLLCAIPNRFRFLNTALVATYPPSYRGVICGLGDLVYVFGRGYLVDNGKKLLPSKGEAGSTKRDRERTSHPCPRFAGEMEWVIGNYCRTTDTVLDPLMGSGTTLLAAKYGGRKCIGIEIEERWCEEAAKAMCQTTIEEL